MAVSDASFTVLLATCAALFLATALPGTRQSLLDALPLPLESSSALAVVLSVNTIFACALLYWRALPKPYPGIPYNAAASKRLMGDLPELMRHVKQHHDPADWFTQQCQNLHSPVTQVFLQPFAKPLIIMTDLREAEVLITRRTREFDRAKITTVLFQHLIPNATIGMPTHDKFKAQRRMWAGTMSSAFVQDVAAPRIHSAMLEMLQLWQTKASLANGHAFQADGDVRAASLDAIWAVTLGSNLDSTNTQIAHLRSLKTPPSSEDPDAAVELPVVPVAPLATAVTDLLNSFEFSAFPGISQFILTRRPWFRKAWKTKERSIAALLTQSRQRFKGNSTSADRQIGSAMDQVLAREEAAVSRFGEQISSDKAMQDELFQFLLAGHETTATTITWALKYLTNSPDVETRLREALHTAFPHSTPTDLPTAHDFVNAEIDIPYLEAVVHETLRMSRTATGIMREATTDTTLLGKPIPNGATLFISLVGQNYTLTEDIPVPNELRYQIPGPKPTTTTTTTTTDVTDASSRKEIPLWPLKNKQAFDPSRWLDASGAFDPWAGPSLPFSAGARGCFGKRLALLELRMALALIVLRFRLLPVPEALNTYDAIEKITRQPKQCYIRLEPLSS